MYVGKVTAPFKYPTSFIASLKDAGVFFGCGYRQVEGVVRTLSIRKRA